MYELERKDFLKKRYISLWAVLGFQAGFINSFGFLAGGKFVSHITGFGTQIGLAIGDKQIFFAGELLFIPLFFILGSFFSGSITTARIDRGLQPKYHVVMMTMPVTLLLLMLLGHFGIFGEFQGHASNENAILLSYALASLCGLQNGCFATLTKGQIRTTHLTGLSTDIGSDISKLVFGKAESKERELIHRTNFSRIATLLSFTAGAGASVSISLRLEYNALFIPAIISALICIALYRIGRSLKPQLLSELNREGLH